MQSLQWRQTTFVIPAKAEIQCFWMLKDAHEVWIPAFAGMTVRGSKRLRSRSRKNAKIIEAVKKSVMDISKEQ